MTINKRELLSELDENKEIYKKNIENAKMTRQNIDSAMKVLDKMMDDLDKDLQ